MFRCFFGAESGLFCNAFYEALVADFKRIWSEFWEPLGDVFQHKSQNCQFCWAGLWLQREPSPRGSRGSLLSVRGLVFSSNVRRPLREQHLSPFSTNLEPKGSQKGSPWATILVIKSETDFRRFSGTLREDQTIPFCLPRGIL